METQIDLFQFIKTLEFKVLSDINEYEDRNMIAFGVQSSLTDYCKSNNLFSYSIKHLRDIKLTTDISNSDFLVRMFSFYEKIKGNIILSTSKGIDVDYVELSNHLTLLSKLFGTSSKSKAMINEYNNHDNILVTSSTNGVIMDIKFQYEKDYFIGRKECSNRFGVLENQFICCAKI